MRPTPRLSRSAPEPTRKTCGVAQAGLPPPVPESRTSIADPKPSRQNANPTPTTEQPHPHRHPRCAGPGSRRDDPPVALPSEEREGSALPFLKQSDPCLKLQNNQKLAPSPSSFSTPVENPSPGAGPLVLRLSKCEWGAGYVNLSRVALLPLPPCPPPHAKSPEIRLAVIQSNRLRVQSTFNQTFPHAPHPTPIQLSPIIALCYTPSRPFSGYAGRNRAT